MEFHLVGKVDEIGRVVAVQSSVQPLDSHCVARPEVHHGAVVRDDRGELEYKLDSKSKEMSHMILHIHRLQEENKLQKKLIDKQEEELKAKDLEIQRLKLNNQQLKAQLLSNDSNKHPSLTSGRQNRQTSFQMTCNVTCSSGSDVQCMSWPTPSHYDAQKRSGVSCEREAVSVEKEHGLDWVDGFLTVDREKSETKTSVPSSFTHGSCDVGVSRVTSDAIGWDVTDGRTSRSDVVETDQPQAPTLKQDQHGYLVLGRPGADTTAQKTQKNNSGNSYRERAADGQIFNFSVTVCQCSPPPPTDPEQEMDRFSDPGYCYIDDEDVDPSGPVQLADSAPGRDNRDRSDSTASDDFKADKSLRNLVQMMRTTMEWQKAKKRLMARSTSCTSDCAEGFLKKVAEECLNVLEKRTDQERRVQRVRRKFKNQPESECITPEFIAKCLYVSSCHAPP